VERIDIIVVGSATLIIMLFILFSPSQLNNIENGIREEYNNWDDPQYVGWDCSNKSVECEKYFETKLNYSCFLVYGIRHKEDHDVGHMWNLVEIDSTFYEFESTTLKFCKVSDRYNVQTMQEGDYINGIRQGKAQTIDNWEELI